MVQQKKWIFLTKDSLDSSSNTEKDIISVLSLNRGLMNTADIQTFFSPIHPRDLSYSDVGIEKDQLDKGIQRIVEAINKKEKIIVYADYDADGITAGAILWEILYQLGAFVMPYIPSRAEEGYGLSKKGIDTVKKDFEATLIITVDHGITAKDMVGYAKTLGIDVVVTDHHVKPENLPECPIIHTTTLSGSGVSWFLAHLIIKKMNTKSISSIDDLLALAAIGTIADMVPLIGPNRSIAKYGLSVLNTTKRVGVSALIADSGLSQGTLGTYDVSHVLAPRLNAMGRLVHAMDALRLLCTKNTEKASFLASKLGETNKERQQLTVDTTAHAIEIAKLHKKEKLFFISSDTYNQGIIGLVAGKIVEMYYRPTIVVSQGEVISKASARSIQGFNIVEVIKTAGDLLIDVGGHPMAAGFTFETKNIDVLKKTLQEKVYEKLNDELLERTIKVDMEIPFCAITVSLYQKIKQFEPFGFGNMEPVFAIKRLRISDTRLVGAEGKHLKIRLQDPQSQICMDAIGFGLGFMFGSIHIESYIDVICTIDLNTWNNKKQLQLKIKDIIISEN